MTLDRYQAVTYTPYKGVASLSYSHGRAEFRSSKKKNLPLAREAATLLLIALARISIQPGIERIMTRFTGAIKCTRPRGDARYVRALS